MTVNGIKLAIGQVWESRVGITYRIESISSAGVIVTAVGQSWQRLFWTVHYPVWSTLSLVR